MEDFHVGPYMTAVGDGELLTEIRIPLRAGRRQRAREGRAPRRRLGDRGRLGGGLARRRHDRRRGDRAQRRRADDVHVSRGRGAAARQGSIGRALRAGGRDRLRGLLPGRRRPRPGRLQAPPRRRPHETRPAPRDRARPRSGGLDERLDHGERRAGHARDRAAPAARPLHPRDTRADRDALGLRHLELRRLRRADGRRAGQVLHDPGGDVRGPRDPHRRVARSRRCARPDPDGLPRDARARSAASARRGC